MIRLRDIATALGTTLENEKDDRPIERLAALEGAGPDSLSYVSSDRYFDRLEASDVAAVLVPEKLKALPKTKAVVIRVPDTELAIAKLLGLFAPPRSQPPVGIDPTARVHASAVRGNDCRIGAHVSIGISAKLGNNVTLHAGVVVGDEVSIGDDCQLFPNVVLRERVKIGNRVIIHANSTIGTDGFGYRWDGKQHMKVPQIGIVVIEDDVEIGSNSCVDRAKFGETVVGRGTKIDNLVQIGHNVRIGQHCILCGGVALAGSTTLGNGVVMGGGSAAADHMIIADGVVLAARAAVAGKTRPKQILAGAPAIPHRDWLKERVNIGRLPDLMKQVRELAAQVELLKAKQSS